MTSFFSKNKRRKGVLALAAIMLLSSCMCLMTACDDDNTTNGTTSVTDSCTIGNGDFEYYADDDNLKLIVSPGKWQKSVGQDSLGAHASASVLESGIVNTDPTHWADMTESTYSVEIEYNTSSGVPNVNKAMSTAKNNWDKMSTYDRLKFYDELQEAMDVYNDLRDDDLELSDFDYYTDYTYSLDYDDIFKVDEDTNEGSFTASPGTHEGYYVYDEESDTYSLQDKNGTNIKSNIEVNKANEGVLMIHNYRKDGYGTAQKYTSDTQITLDANTAAKISVWVKTQDLTYNNGETVNGLRGANICVSHSVGNATLEEFQINNIDTSGVTDNYGWVEYTIYVKAASYASSTFSMVLGLGHGSSTDSFEYVEGYAFFDDVDMEKISMEEYNLATQSVPSCTLSSPAEQKKFNVDSALYADDYVYALDLHHVLQSVSVDSDVEVDVGLTTTTLNGIEYDCTNFKDWTFDTSNDIHELTSWNELDAMTASNHYLNAVWEDDFNEDTFPFAKDQDLLMLFSAHGAAYTAKMTEKASSGIFTLDKDEYMLVSFWLKTSDTSVYDGAIITLYDETNKTTLGSYNTTNTSGVDLDDQEDIFDGWIQCFFFVENTSLQTRDFHLEFSYGLQGDDFLTKDRRSFYEGYAAFTGFEYTRLTKTEYSNFANTASHCAAASLKGTSLSGEKFDEVGNIDKSIIEETLASPLNYNGVEGGSVWTGGTNGTASADVNKNANAGLLNRDYADTYFDNNADWFKNLTLSNALDKLTWWNELFGSSTQPLLISNVVEQSYGYLSVTKQLSKNSYSALAVRVKVSAGAVAYVYLIDTSDLFDGYANTLNVNPVNVTYWYDDDGNVCLMDPDDEDFNAKEDVAFLLTENGLYTNNMNTADESYYANLANYEKDKDGNLIVQLDETNTPTITYEYYEGYEDDGIAFYYNDGKYYAYYDLELDEYSVEVKDLASYVLNQKTFAKEYARYLNQSYLTANGWNESDLGENVTVTNANSTDSYIIVDGNNPEIADKWITVSFYVATGREDISYRLEVFSGSRDGSVTNPAGSYVIFDNCVPGDLSASYDGLLEEAIEDMTDANGYTDSTLNQTVYLKEDKDSGRLVYANGAQEDAVYENADYYCYTFYDDAAYQRYDKSLDEEENGNPYSNYLQSNYSEQLTYLYYETETAANETTFSMFLNYQSLYTQVEADGGLDTDEDEDEDEWWTDPDFWLLLSSIILTVVLIIVLLITLSLRLMKRFASNPTAKNRYTAKRMHYIRKLNLQTEEEDEEEETQASIPQQTQEDDDNPYND